jgi:hypothetical protein
MGALQAEARIPRVIEQACRGEGAHRVTTLALTAGERR